MPSLRIASSNKNGIYFLTFTSVKWYYLFDRHNRWQLLADSLQFCIKNKKLLIYAYVFMLNHIHLLVDSPNVIEFTRDFKHFTSSKLKKNIEATEPEVLKLFLSNNTYHFWQPTNMPLLIETEKFFNQKITYIHQNPVKKQYVTQEEYWYWSSANPDNPIPITQLT